MKKILAAILIGLGLFGTAKAVSVFNSNQVGSTPLPGYILQTNGTTSAFVATSTLGFTGGGGSGTIGGSGTSTQIAYFSASSTLTSSPSLTFSGTLLQNTSTTTLATTTVSSLSVTASASIGTSTPKEVLHVVGNVRIGQSKNGIYPYLPTTTANPLNSTTTTINVTDTSGFPSVGTIRLDNEFINCTGITATAFTGCTRAALGSTAASHVLSSTVRSVYFVIEHDDSNPNLYITDTGNTDMQLGLNIIPAAYLDIHANAPACHTPLLRVGSSNAISEFEVDECDAVSFGNGISSGGMYIGSTLSGVYSINTPQSLGNKLTIWDASSNGTWNANGSIILQPFGGLVGIGTTTPAATLHIKGTATVPPLLISSSTSSTLFKISPTGEMVLGGGSPTMGTCGTSPSISGNDQDGTVTVGAGVVTSCAVLFGKAKTGTPHVFITVDGVTAIANSVSSVSSAGFTVNFAATLGSGTFDYFVTSN